MKLKRTYWKYGNAFTDGSIVQFYVGTKTYGDLWATVDAADWERVKDLNWSAQKMSNLFYARNSKGGQKSLHRFLTNFEWPVVDHKDGNGLNNRRNNLRRCETKAENTILGWDRRRGCTKADAELKKFLNRRRQSWERI